MSPKPKLITYKNISKTRKEWEIHFGFKKDTISKRIQQGWPVEKIMETPLAPRNFSKIKDRKCLECGTMFRQKPSNKQRYCTLACKCEAQSKYPLIERNCKSCNKSFICRDEVNDDAIKRNAGTYCSKKCQYDAKSTSKSLYSRFLQTRNKFVNRYPFCNYCGSFGGRLEVHHIIPVALERDDSDFNLVTLCPPHHKRFEKLSREITRIGLPAGRDLAAIISTLFWERWMYIAGTYNFKKKDIKNGRFKIRNRGNLVAETVQK